MKKILFALSIFASLCAKAQNEMVVDPNAEVRTLNGSFSSIKVNGAIDVYVSQSDNEAVAVSASEDKFIRKIHTEVDNGVLKIYYEKEGGLHFGINTKDRKLKAYVSFKDISKLDINGACDVHVAGMITESKLQLSCSGASSFNGNVKVDDLEMDLSGASDIRIGGSAKTVDISSTGASDVKGFDLQTDVCTAKASGASDINITVNKELNAHATGASSIMFKGEGAIKDRHSSGASSIERKS
ncbi:MAG TPA: head GIN domain-containing protein [Ferruginibacter sp.]|nr:head GIN domain-containing protein [Ferruginibacter sp.]